MIVSCNVCNTQFNKSLRDIKNTKNNYCSRECFGIAKKHAPRKERTCVDCNIKFYSKKSNKCSKRFCDNCRKKYENITEYLKSYSIKEYLDHLNCWQNKDPSYKSSGIGVLNRKWNKDLLDYACQNCNYELHIELCHITGIANFDDSATLGIVNSPNNILVLCRNCHWEFDHNLLDIKDIRGRSDLLPSEIRKAKRINSQLIPCSSLSCNNLMHYKAKICKKCSYIGQQKIEWPTLQDLISLLQKVSFVEAGKILNVSDNAIRKHLKTYGINPKTLKPF